MSARTLLLTFATTMTVLFLAQSGWTADYFAPQPPDTDSGTQSQATDTDCCTQSQPCAAACGPCRQFFGEFLYLRPRNEGLEYAVPINGPITPGQVPIQAGRTAALDPQYEPGFRVGLATAFDECSSISATFTRYENTTDDSISITQPPFVIYPLVVHPSTLNAGATFLDARAHEYLEFDLADIDYRDVFYADECATVNYLVGIRYASLKQQFDSQFESIIRENVNSTVNFDGGGFRVGLEAERHSRCRNLFLYGKTSASFLGGEFRGSYLQSSINDPQIAETTWKEARFVSILDVELGIGWTSANGHVRASAGYMAAGWLNVVKLPEFVSAVQANQYHGPDKIDGNGLVFDGLVARVELRR